MNETKYDKINKCNVAILSLRNKLKECKSVDELTMIASKIIELEQEVLLERSIRCKKLDKERKKIENKIDKLNRKLDLAKLDLQIIDDKIHIRIESYKKQLEKRMKNLEDEYENISNMI